METNMANKYKVAPFSGARFSENEAKCRPGELPCGICGKPMDPKRATHSGIVIKGGAEWGDEKSPQDGGHMGGFPVGPDCHRKHLIREDTAPRGPDAECNHCGKMYWSAEGHRHIPLCPDCK